MTWQPIKTVPHDEMVLLGVWVKHKRDEKAHVEYYPGYYNSEKEEILDINNEASLPFDELCDYDFWMPIPRMPEVK